MKKEFYKYLGKNIRLRRKELKLTQQNLADKIGLTLNFVGKIESATSKPSLSTLVAIAEQLNTTVSDLTKIP